MSVDLEHDIHTSQYRTKGEPLYGLPAAPGINILPVVSNNCRGGYPGLWGRPSFAPEHPVPSQSVPSRRTLIQLVLLARLMVMLEPALFRRVLPAPVR